MIKLNRKVKNNLLMLFFAAMFILVSLSPLVPNAEVETRLMVNSIGIDANEEGVTLTAETINGGNNEVVYGQGRILAEAFQNLNERYGRRIELGHCGLIALGDMITREDAVSIFMNLLSDGLINSGCSVVSANVSAREFISQAVMLTKSTGSGISGFVTFSDTQAAVTIPSLLETMQSLKSKSATAILPIIGFKEKEEDKGQGSTTPGGDSSAQSSSQNSEGTKETEIDPPRSARVLGKETLELQYDDIKGLIWVFPRSKGGMMEADLEVDGKNYELRAVIEDNSPKVTAEFTDKPTITMQVDVKLRFTERYAMLTIVENGMKLNELFDKMNAAYTARIEEELRRTAELSKQEDFLGFKTHLYRADPKKYREWSGDMADLEVNFDVKVKVL